MKRESTINVLCYGDSNTYGYDPSDGFRYSRAVRWPGRLQELAGDGFQIIEEGCNGRTASVTPPDEPWKDGRSSLLAVLNSHKPIDALIVMLGSNDLKKEFGASPSGIAKGIKEILLASAAFLKEKQGFVPRGLLIAPPEISHRVADSPFGFSFDGDAILRAKALPALYKAVAEDITQTGRMPCGFLNAGEFLSPSPLDGLHLPPAAHQILAEKTAAWLTTVFS